MAERFSAAIDQLGQEGVLAFRPLPLEPRHQRRNWSDTLLALPRAELPGAARAGADLHDAALYHANLTRADLRGANLAGADLRGAIISGVNFRGAIRDDRTQLPPGTVWPKPPRSR